MCPSNQYKRLDDNRVKVTCGRCKQDFELAFTKRQQLLWNGGAYIQNVAPELLPDQRELLISGTCGVCFDAMFGDDDADA